MFAWDSYHFIVGFETVSIIILMLSILGMIIIILRHLPDAVEMQEKNELNTAENLEQKGIPASTPSKWKSLFGFWVKRMWHFFLEAKNVRPGNKVGYQLKKMLRRTKPMESGPIIPPSIENVVLPKQDEDYYLERIKEDPRNLDNYKGLGTFYVDNKLFAEARDVYIYLAKHLPGDAAMYAKLAYTHFQLKEFSFAIQNYEKSLALDSTQPNRYYNLALSHEALQDFEKASEVIKKALTIEPNNQKYKDTLVRIESRLL